MIDESLAAHLHAVFGEGSDWAVVGGHAANLYRHDARTTVDTDISAVDNNHPKGHTSSPWMALRMSMVRLTEPTV